MGIEAEIGDAIATLDAMFKKRRTQPFAALAEFAVGELPLSRNDSNFVGEQIHGALETADRC
jgi:hypothetical protein